MKRSITIALALLIAATAQALPRHTILAIPAATWQDASPIQRDRLKTFFRRFSDPKATRAIGTTRYVHTASGKDVLLCCFWTNQLLRHPEKITDAKIATVKAQLADAQIRIVMVDDIQAQLTAWGLVPYVDPESEDIP